MRQATIITGLDGTLDALRGGRYLVGAEGLRFIGARVVSDAVVDGFERGNRARLRVSGSGVPSAKLVVESHPHTTRVTGTVAGRNVALRLATGP